jgi:hypothetical protein
MLIVRRPPDLLPDIDAESTLINIAYELVVLQSLAEDTFHH